MYHIMADDVRNNRQRKTEAVKQIIILSSVQDNLYKWQCVQRTHPFSSQTLYHPSTYSIYILISDNIFPSFVYLNDLAFEDVKFALLVSPTPQSFKCALCHFFNHLWYTLYVRLFK